MVVFREAVIVYMNVTFIHSYKKERESEEKIMNKVILMGRLTRDPEVRYSQNQEPIAIARYTLAVDRRGRKGQGNDEQTADFISCVAFGKAGEFVEKYCKQGTKLVVSGRIQTGSYTNKDGNKVYTTEVVIEEQEFAESKASSGDAGNQPMDRPVSGSPDGFMNIPEGIENNLPFK